MALTPQDPHKAVITSVGSAVGGGTANSTKPVITGTADADTTVDIFDGVRMIGTAIVDSKGNWSFTPTADLKAGSHSFTAISVDSNGDMGASSTPMSVTVPSGKPVAPPQPIINAMTDDSGASIPAGSTTADAHPHISGTGVAGDTITVYDNGTVIGSTTVGGDGKWSFTPATDLSNGTHSITAVDVNAAGTPSAASGAISVVIVAGVPATPAAPTLTDDDNNAIPAGSTTKDGHPHISGAGTAGDVITVYDGGTVLGSTIVAGNGTWTFTPSTDLATGSHSISVTDTNAAGTSSAHSASAAFIYAILPTETVTISGVYAHEGGTELLIASGAVTYDGFPIVRGSVSASLQPGESLVVYRDGVALPGTATLTGNNWSFNDTSVPVGAHTYTACVVSNAGPGAASSGYSITESAGIGKYKVSPLTPINGHSYYPISFDFTGVMLPPGTLYYAQNGYAVALNSYIGGSSYTYNCPGLDPSGSTLTLIYAIDSAHAVAGKGLVAAVFTNSSIASGLSSWHDMTNQYFPPTALTSVNAGQHDPVILAEASLPAATAHSDNTDAQGGNAAETHPVQHTVVGEHDAFIGKSGNDTVDLNADPSSYFKESSAHIQGSTDHPTEPAGTTPAVNTLHLTGDHQVLDLTSLTGKTAAAKISGIEVIDLGGHENHLKLSLLDVLNLGEQDLFVKDGHQQLMVNGSNGDTVDLSNAHIAGVADGQWQAEGTAVVGGVTYNVYEHSGAHTELLVQQGVQIVVH